MVDGVGQAYDAVAGVYVERFGRELIEDADAEPWLDRFVDLIDRSAGSVLDLGCGPGIGVHTLHERGLDAVGVDASGALLEAARAAFPHLAFRHGDFTRLDVRAGSVAGILARYSIIHVAPDELDEVVAEWARVLRADAPVLLFFFASRHPDDHGRPFDHAVMTAHELFPATLAVVLERNGFVALDAGAAPPPEGGRPFGKGVVLARRAAATAVSDGRRLDPRR
ncbi:MAG: class I SAM-dependent methyltransferase [Actinomycetota bacterium]